MSKKSLADLIDNAFDFLEVGITQFDTDPKYSVINFCAAVELLLKARLLSEHWSLIVSNNPNLNDFNSGNFKSLNFKDLIPKIESVTGERIPKDATDAFNALANHRNKVMHFFHEAYSKSAMQNVIENIAIEQCNGWFYLRRLLEKWNTIFSDYGEKIDEINRKMKRHKIYLNTVYERLKPELKEEKSKGIKFTKCNRCLKPASEEIQKTEFLYLHKCRVCLYEEYSLKVPCPTEDCEHHLIFSEENFDNKLQCEAGHDFEKNGLAELLDTNPTTYDNYFEQSSKNCANCCSHDSVIEHNEYYICLECFYVSDDIAYCEWCNEGQIAGGDLEMSHYSGCEFCDGKSGWEKD